MNDEFIKRIERELDKAEVKHPHFADVLNDYGIEWLESYLNALRRDLKYYYQKGGLTASAVLLCEVFEALVEIEKGNLAAAQEELAQVGAVLCRIDQMIKQANREKKEKEKKEKGKSSEIF